MPTGSKQKKLRLKVTILASAYFGLDEISQLEQWRDSILELGAIDSERVEVDES
jgi:hypothetical protein